MSLLTDPIVLRAALVLVVAAGAFLLAVWVIRRLRRGLAEIPTLPAQIPLFSKPCRSRTRSKRADLSSDTRAPMLVMVICHCHGFASDASHDFLGKARTRSTHGFISNSGALAGSTSQVIRAPGNRRFSAAATGRQ